LENETESDATTFADGVIVMLGPNWSSTRSETTPQLQGARSNSMDPFGNIGQPERATQNRVIRLLHDELDYRYLGDWTDRDNNSNIEEKLLTANLAERGYTPAQINVAIHKLLTEANNHNRNLYGNNQAVYSLLRYGVPVKIEAGKVTEAVHLIDWNKPRKNDFAVAEEVTLHGNHERRPDLVLYINGIAIGVIELKNSRVSIGDGTYSDKTRQVVEIIDGKLSHFREITLTDVNRHLEFDGAGHLRMLVKRGHLETVVERGRITAYVRKNWPPDASIYKHPVGITYCIQTWFRLYLQQWILRRMSDSIVQSDSLERNISAPPPRRGMLQSRGRLLWTIRTAWPKGPRPCQTPPVNFPAVVGFHPADRPSADLPRLASPEC
jgi:hypothetical protein